MLGFLFRGLTAEPARGAPLFDAVTREARRPSWYIEGGIADTLDGRFALLSTIAAVVIVRLEQEGSAGDRMSVAFTERFIEVMESEHRELGIGDPTLGRTVRKLVSLLARRTELMRQACTSTIDWTTAARESLYKVNVAPGAPEALRHCADALKDFSSRLADTNRSALEKGELE